MLILFVCTGNTCRSPMAEYYFRYAAEHYNKESGSDLSVASAGICALPGSRMSDLAVSALEKNEIPSSLYSMNENRDNFRYSVQIDQKIMENADIVFGITRNHSERLRMLFPQFKDKIFSLPLDIPDPYGGNAQDYEKCFAQIKKAIDILFTENFFAKKTTESGKVLIVPVNENHLGEICTIENESFSDPWSRMMFLEIMENPLSIGLTAVKDGCIAGYLLAYDLDSEFQILNIAVKRDYRNQKIATEILKFAENYCKTKGIEEITLEVRSRNEAAIGLYEKIGFKTVGRRKNYYHKPPDDAILMNLEIAKKEP